MKRLFCLFLFSLISIFAFSQEIKCFNYQAVIRDTSGVEIPGQTVQFKVSILQGEYGIPVYVEEHSVVTDSLGLFQLSVGCGSSLEGSYDAINWAYSPVYLLCEIDTSGVGDYAIMGFNQLLSVPYAIFAAKTGDTAYWKDSDTTDLYNNSQSIGIGTLQVDSSAAIEVASDSLGLLLPRLTTFWRDDIEDPEPGLMIFNYDCECINVYNGFEWVEYGKSENVDFTCGDVYIDERDGQRYPTIQIGPQCWMTKNLAYGIQMTGVENPANNDTIEKYCYDDVPANCTKLGGLYTWDELMQYDTLVGNQGICPEGWHLPETYEFDTLQNYLNVQSGMGNALKSGGSSGFDALFSGMRDGTGMFSGKDQSGFYWSATQNGSDKANYFSVSSGNSTIHSSDTTKMDAFSVRCVKGLPFRLDTSVVIIDTNIYQLISDSAEIANGIFRYLIIGREEQDIDVGDIIVQFFGDIEKQCGHANVVKTIERIGQVLEIITDDEYWEAVIAMGEIEEKFKLFENIMDYVDPTNPNLSFNKLNDNGFQCYIQDLVLGPPNSLNVKITSGYVKIICNPIFKAKFKNGFEYLSMSVEPIEISANLNCELYLAGGEYEKEHPIEILSFSKALPPITMGSIPFPLLLELDFSLYLNSYVKLKGNFLVTKKIKFNAKYEMGYEFKYGKLNKIWKKPIFIFDTKNVAAENELSAELRLALEPRVGLSAYCQGGPFINTSTYIEGVYHKNFDTDDFDIGVFWGNDIQGGLTSKTLLAVVLDNLFDKNEAKITLKRGKPDTLFLAPAGFHKEVFGDGQNGFVGQTLAKDLKVRVINSLGKPERNAPVYFENIHPIPEYKPGIPNFTESDAVLNPTKDYSENDGLASSKWTLGAKEGTYRSEAFVRNANGREIGIHLFTATTLTCEIPIVETGIRLTTSETTATCEGSIISDFGCNITQKGICWNYEREPDIYDYITNNGSGNSSFIGEMTNLLPDTAIFVKAYAINEKGVGYGSQKVFSIGSVPPVVSTDSIVINEPITDYFTVDLYGALLYNGNSPMSEKGFCWSLSPEPDTSDNKIICLFSFHAFTSNSWQVNTTYYVRAYGINEMGVGYGEEKTFELTDQSPPIITIFGINASPDVLPFDNPLTTYSNDVTVVVHGWDNNAITGYLINYHRGNNVYYPALDDTSWISIPPLSTLDTSFIMTLNYDSLNNGDCWRLVCFLKDSTGNISLPHISSDMHYRYRSNVSLTDDPIFIYPPQSLDDHILSLYEQLYMDDYTKVFMNWDIPTSGCPHPSNCPQRIYINYYKEGEYVNNTTNRPFLWYFTEPGYPSGIDEITVGYYFPEYP